MKNRFKIAIIAGGTVVTTSTGMKLEKFQSDWFGTCKSVTIDSNRTAFVIFHPEKQLYDIIPFNKDWAVQDLVSGSLSEKQKTLLTSL